LLTGTLATIEAKLAENPIERTAIIFIGSALGAQDFGESSLYDAHYQRRFRGRDGL
ncbi:MAG: precorrin-4 C(11)-methyltransferase, partial [Mesorhizobium sp.]